MGTRTRRPGTGQPQRLETALLLRAYSAGLFPMADTREAVDVFWVEPRRRGLLPLEKFHLPKSLAKVLKQGRFFHTQDMAFAQVIRACAEAAPGREQSWINASILDGYSRLHAEGHAHSIETWDADGRLVGGLYGVRLGSAFFGESMFSRATDASKAALAHLVARLRLGGFELLDTQFLTAHLAQFGAMEVKRTQYLALLDAALGKSGDWGRIDREAQVPGVGSGVAGAGAAAGAAVAGFGAAGRDLVALPALPVALLAALGPSGKRIVQLLSQTS
ncbi:leucyl/phenylalanyl-tRNA--protein transferase [Sandaracinobacter neustonicus]|uniref:Leucyl/phenylalanyl-tRNA--protein transferase n=1 Tax=Sandaracinobacter neustonicus TaxID=1715348 RepID=A0A501XQT0_9SPHN|nr:leucyl/phenylalanyl-tRNA--protein transferase [Sandaracinobacter neustonicus]TPE62457.1 leucyl/phenylalanyl-tRNA--protein transferase [Sandaracinobacter neustonicus]